MSMRHSTESTGAMLHDEAPSAMGQAGAQLLMGIDDPHGAGQCWGMLPMLTPGHVHQLFHMRTPSAAKAIVPYAFR